MYYRTVHLLVFRELGTASYVRNNTCKSQNDYRVLRQDCCVEAVSPLKPSGHYMYHQFNIQQFDVLPTQCIYVFCVDLRTNSDYFPTQR